MSLGGGGSAPEAKVPARKPDRTQSVQTEDIQVGGSQDDSSSTQNGKRSLIRPVSSSLGAV